MLSAGPFDRTFATSLVYRIFYKWMYRFCCKLTLVVLGAMAWNSQPRGSGDQRSRSQESEVRFGGLAEASFATPLQSKRVFVQRIVAKRLLMCYRFPYVGADLCKPVLQPGISEHCETTDMGWCIMRYACLLSQLSPGTHFSLTAEGGFRLSRPGCLILRRGGLYPSQHGHPPRH